MKEPTQESYLEIISTKYNLPDLEFIGVSDKGISSYNTILKTSDGRRLFVKQYKKDDAERRANSNIIERYLAEHSSIPVVLPLETIEGESSLYIDDKLYAVFDYQEHNDDPALSSEKKSKQIYELAKTLGALHSVPITDALFKVNEIERWEPKTIQSRLDHLERFEIFIKAKKTRDTFDTEALEAIQERKDMLKVFNTTDNVPITYSICHGDYHSQNVLFDDNMNVIGVCDWDICGLSDPYIDFFNSFKMAVIGRKYDSYQEERRDIGKIFLQGYKVGSNFDFDMNRLLSAAQTLSQVVIGSSWPLEEHYFMEHTKTDEYLQKEIEKARFFSKNFTKIHEFISLIDAETTD